ncbi:unnamed protein product [Brassica rapa subsp. trilocularis]
MKKFWESIHKKRPQMEKAVKTFERVNTSKGGRAIPEDQRPDCFFFIALQCNFRYVCSHEGMSRPPSRRDNTKQHPPMRRRANNKPNSRSNQSCHQQHRHRSEHLRLRLGQHKPISRPKLLLQPVQTANDSSLQLLRLKHGRSRVRHLGTVNRKRISGVGELHMRGNKIRCLHDGGESDA